MKKRTYIIFIVLLGFVFSCENKWDEHYAKNIIEGETFDGNLLDYVKSDPSFSKFYDALIEAGMESELEKKQIMTLWLPNNDAIGDITLTGDELVRLLNYHINITAIYDHLFDGIISSPELKARVKTLNEKYVTLYDADGGYKVNDAAIINPNTVTNNGVVHEISKLLSTRLNGYEYIETLGDDYSYIKDFINDFNYLVFDKEQSTPIGFDDVGQVVYDSVWINQNEFFEENGDLRLEDPMYTIFISSNEVIDASVNDLISAIADLGGVADSADARMWCLNNFFSTEYYSEYPSDFVIHLATEELWYTPKQEVNQESVALSNGSLYEVTKLHVPRYTAMSPFTINFFNNWKSVKGTAMRVNGSKEVAWPDTENPMVYFFASHNYVNPADPLDLTKPSPGDVLRYRSGGGAVAGQIFGFEFKLNKIDADLSTTDYKVAPGEYDITVFQRERYTTHNIRFSLITPSRQDTLVVNESYTVAESGTDRTTSHFVASIDFGSDENRIFTEGVNTLRVEALNAPYNLMLRSVTFSPKLSISNY